MSKSCRRWLTICVVCQVTIKNFLGLTPWNLPEGSTSQVQVLRLSGVHFAAPSMRRSMSGFEGAPPPAVAVNPALDRLRQLLLKQQLRLHNTRTLNQVTRILRSQQVRALAVWFLLRLLFSRRFRFAGDSDSGPTDALLMALQRQSVGARPLSRGLQRHKQGRQVALLLARNAPGLCGTPALECVRSDMIMDSMCLVQTFTRSEDALLFLLTARANPVHEKLQAGFGRRVERDSPFVTGRAFAGILLVSGIPHIQQLVCSLDMLQGRTRTAAPIRSSPSSLGAPRYSFVSLLRTAVPGVPPECVDLFENSGRRG